MQPNLSRNILLALVSLIVALLVAEGALRLTEQQPGLKTHSKKFKQVDPLLVFDEYAADSHGIMAISRKTRDSLCRELEAKRAKDRTWFLTPWRSLYKNLYKVLNDFIRLHRKSYHSDFKLFVESLDSATTEKDVAAAIKSYVNCPFNSSGFRSIEFRKYATKKKSVLLLGDSFTWGSGISNTTNSFADLLFTKGYVVYNTGIIGTDPAQYLQTARTWVPQLMPDYVVVNFYMGNDVFYFERQPQPYQPALYNTNAGMLLSCPEGVYFKNAMEAYSHMLSISSIPTDSSLFNRLCATTAVTTLVWRALAKRNLVNAGSPGSASYDLSKVIRYEKPFSNNQVAQIKAIAEQHGARFIIAAIPSVRKEKLFMPGDEPGLFEGLQYFVPPVSLQHYKNVTDGHYNDTGHAVHAAFVDSLLRTYKK